LYNRNSDVLKTLSVGYTILILSKGYGKDYLYFKVKFDGSIGYVYGHDPIEFHLKHEEKQMRGNP